MRLRALLLGMAAMALSLPATAEAGRRGKVDWSQYIDKDAGKRPPASNTTASKTTSKASAKRAKKKPAKRRMKARSKRVRGKKK